MKNKLNAIKKSINRLRFNVVLLYLTIIWYNFFSKKITFRHELYIIVYVVLFIMMIYDLFIRSFYRKCKRCTSIITDKEFLSMSKFECPYCGNTDL